jgi:hypothetical protein
MWSKGEDIIKFVDESLYLSYSKSTWWIDSGATTHVANSMQGMSTSKILTRGARTIKVANGIEAAVEAIGDLPIKLKDGFTLQLHDVLYVPSSSHNLISVSCLADYGFECQFSAQHCSIKLNNVIWVLPSDKTNYTCWLFMIISLNVLIMYVKMRMLYHLRT